jgi:toxin HigB-1
LNAKAGNGWKRLEILDAATSLAELGMLPSNRLEALHGNRDGQWRICFVREKGAVGPSDVEMVDYH